MSAQLLGPTPLHSVVATSVTADQKYSLSSLGTVSAVEQATATGYTLSLVDSAGGGASIPVVAISSSGGPPITATQISTQAATVNILDDGATPTGLRIQQGTGVATISMTDAAGAGSSITALTLTSTGGPPATAVQMAANAPLSHASALQSGLATIAIGQSSVSVAVPAITANSVVVFSPLAAPDATCVGIRVVLTAGTGFALTGAANATAAVPLAWFVAKY